MLFNKEKKLIMDVVKNSIRTSLFIEGISSQCFVMVSTLSTMGTSGVCSRKQRL